MATSQKHGVSSARHRGARENPTFHCRSTVERQPTKALRPDRWNGRGAVCPVNLRRIGDLMTVASACGERTNVAKTPDEPRRSRPFKNPIVADVAADLHALAAIISKGVALLPNADDVPAFVGDATTIMGDVMLHLTALDAQASGFNTAAKRLEALKAFDDASAIKERRICPVENPMGDLGEAVGDLGVAVLAALTLAGDEEGTPADVLFYSLFRLRERFRCIELGFRQVPTTSRAADVPRDSSDVEAAAVVARLVGETLSGGPVYDTHALDAHTALQFVAKIIGEAA